MPPLYLNKHPVDRFLRYLKSKKPYDIDLVKSYMEIQYPNGFYDFSEENDNYLNWLKKVKRQIKLPDCVSEDITFEMLLYEKIQYGEYETINYVEED